MDTRLLVTQNHYVVHSMTADTECERNALMEKVYPKLKSFCQEQGYEFQIVDMRWGVRDEATNDHMTTELCMKEIKACQKLSVGPNFVTFLSHKYGYRPIPKAIPARQYELITQDVSGSEQQLLNKWYVRDNNAIPPTYQLQPIDAVIPQFGARDPAMQKAGQDKWWHDFESLQAVLERGAKKHLQSEAEVKRFLMSVTEHEIELGVLMAEDTSKNCLWFKRVFDDIDDVKPNKELARYYECLNDEKTVQTAHSLLNDLREERLPQNLSQHNILQYNIHWQDKGVNTASNEHKSYIDSLCRDFETRVKDLIEVNIAQQQRLEVKDPAYNEALQHAVFGRSKCQVFHGRNDILATFERYVKGSCSMPLIVYGDSGCGKTSLVAMAARASWDWMEGSGALVYRFIGTSQNSFAVRPLLNSVNLQLRHIYAPHTDRAVGDNELKGLIDEFMYYLKHVPKERPLVLLFDSLDQLDTADGARQLDWLPRLLPKHVKMILSTLPDDKYGCLPRCRILYPKQSCYIQVSALKKDDINGILDKWLKASERCLTMTQRGHVVKVIEHCPLPLYLKLSFDEALRWHSYDSVDVTSLHHTVEAMINALFERVEKTHGQLMVSRALSYLTVAENGITEVEMEDMLSLDDDVLNDVYVYWTPPIRRLPPLLWVRVRNDLDEYLVDRGVDGFQLIYWYHRQFIETARLRYLTNDDFCAYCHEQFADYYLGIWSDQPKPYTTKQGQEETAQRYVSAQPLVFPNGQYNTRKLTQLPYHLIHAGDKTTLKDKVLCNYEFLLAKMTSLGLRSVLHDMRWTQTTTLKDRDISIILETLQLSQDALETHPAELASQLIGRIHGYGAATVSMVTHAKAKLRENHDDKEFVRVVTTLVQMLELLMRQVDKKNAVLNCVLENACHSSMPVLIPHTGFLMPPGGQLRHKLSGHFDKVNDIDVTALGTTIATASDDRTVKLWDVMSGELVHSVDLPCGQPMFLRFTADAEYLVVSATHQMLYIVKTNEGTLQVSTKQKQGGFAGRPLTVCQTTNGTHLALLMREKYIDILSAATGDLMLSISDKLGAEKTRAWSEQKIIASCGSHVVYCAYLDDEFYHLNLTENLTKLKPQKVKVFGKEADWTNRDDLDYISQLVVPSTLSKGCEVIICNGHTQDFLFYSLLEGQPIRVIPGGGQSASHISHMVVSSAHSNIYAAVLSDIHIVSLAGSDQHKVTLHHPCYVTKVLPATDEMVVTIGVDNILRIWDQKQEPFAADMSMFTGQVGVASNESANQWQGMLNSMFSDFSEEYRENASDLLTTKQSKHYWTKCMPETSKDNVVQALGVTTKYHAFTNERYLGVTQDVASGEQGPWWTQCFSVWDLTDMQCVRRMFPPRKAMCFHCIVGSQAVLSSSFVDGSETNDAQTNLIDLGSWTAVVNISGVTIQPKGRAVYEATNNVLLLPTTPSELSVCSAQTGCVCATLSPSNSAIQWHHNQRPHKPATFEQIQAMQGSHLVAAWGTCVICVWNMTSFELAHEFALWELFGGHDLGSSTVQLSRSGNHTHLCAALDSTFSHCPDNHSVLVFDVATGSIKTGLSKTKKTNARWNMITPMLRLSKECTLQLVAMNSQGQAHLLSEVPLGHNARHLTVSRSGLRCVTWCSLPVEQRIHYWDMSTVEIKKLATFTPEETVGDVTFINDTDDIAINCASGLIKLQLCGTSVKQQVSMLTDDPILFHGTDLDVQLTKV